MKNKTLFATLMLSLLSITSWATDIPLTVGTYLTTSEAEITGTINKNDGGNLGGIKKTNTPTTATFSSLTVSETQNLVLSFLTGNNNSSRPKVTVTLNNGTSDIFTTGEVDIENPGTGNWTPVTMHTFDLGSVPAGTYSLKFTFDNSNTSDYVCNLGSIGLYNKSSYISSLDAMPGDVTLNKGKYNTARIEGDGNVGYMSNGATAYYPSLYVSNAGKATLNIGLYYYGDGTLNVKITDLSTGKVEVNKDIAITSAVCHGLETTTAFELGDITAGYKSMKFTVSNAASFLCNYKALNLGIESFTDIAIDLRSGQLGTSGSNMQKYLTIDGEAYNYADEAPATYNALLSAGSYNGGDHGYVNFKAKVPVKAGIYKITLGTCQFGTGTGYVKNANESSTLNIVDKNGQTMTSFNQNTGACYHNNTTDNVVSVWYEAESDETITIVCGDYTPYFSIERVNAVPALKYVVTYVNDTEGATGTVPDTKYVDGGESVTLWENRTLYKEGYTLTGWNDGTSTHAIGSSITPTANTTLTAVFTANTYSIDQSLTELTVRWDFQRQNHAPTVGWLNRTGDFLVTQTSVNGETIDVKVVVNTTNGGKFANANWTDWAQVNEGTTFVFPSMNGTTVKAYSKNEPKNNSDVKSNLDGNEYSSYSSYVASYSTTEESGSSTLTIKGGGYYRYIAVTYPANDDDLLVKSITVDGVALGGDILAPINFNNPHTATLSDNVYTTVPAVVFTLKDNSEVNAVVSGTGTSRTYTVETTIDETAYTFTLTIGGIHTYSKGVGEETVNLKYTSEQVSDNVWSNGVYSLSPVGDGWNNSGFKLNKNNNPFTLTVPSDVQVKQFIIHEFKDNYIEGAFNTITSEGMTTAYIPTKHNLPNTDEGKYNLIINLADHHTGQPIVFCFTGGSQITGWYELTIAKSNPGTAPTKTAQSVTVDHNHAVVAVTFDREIANNVEATINNTTVTAEGGASTLYFPVWDLSYSTNYTLTIAANAAEDTYGNKNASAIEIAVNIPAKTAVSAAIYDYVVGTASEFSTAIAAVNSSNTSASATRKTIFIKNGDYDFGSTEQRISGFNISLIGESRDGVVLHGRRTGISNPVLNIRDRSGFYLQDLTVKNDFDYGTGSFNGVAVAIYGGDKTIMKNVRMLSNQDTQVTGHRGYFDNCEIHGTVDFICGGGDNYYYQTDLILENRSGNCITAPSTSSALKWGYVFESCTISPVENATATIAGYSLGRPWQDEPRATYLNTTMNVLPQAAGWTSMNKLTTHFGEYGSIDDNSSAVDLSGRTVTTDISVNAYTPVLTSGEAAKFTLQNVLGGTDSWLPTDYTTVMAAPSVSLSDGSLSWEAVTDARCYVIFKDGKYLANQTETGYTPTAGGTYSVRAANEMGGLGTVSNEVVVVVVSSAGWASFSSTKALDFTGTGVTAYIAKEKDASSVSLSSIAKVPAETGLVLNAEEGKYAIPVLASDADATTGNLLKANLVDYTLPASQEINSTTYYNYTLAYESSSPVFKHSTGNGTLAAGKAYLQITTNVASAPTLRFDFDEENNATDLLNSLNSSNTLKFFENGHLYILRNGITYDALGRIVK